MRRVRFNNDNANNLDSQFQDRLRNIEVEPPQRAWDKVAFELDEEKARTKHDHWYYALLILLIPLTIANLWITYDLEGYYNALAKAKTTQLQERELGCTDYYTPSQLLAYGSIEPPAELILLEGSLLGLDHPPTSEILPLSKNNKAIIPSQTGNEHLVNLSDENAHAISVKETEIMASNIITARLSDDRLNAVRLEKRLEDELGRLKGFYFGVDAAFNKSNLLVKKDALSPIVGEEINKERDWGRYFGLTLGYNFSHKFGVELEWIFKSIQGQKYWEERYGGKILINGEIDLQYMHFPVLCKYKFTRISPRTGNARVVNFVLGPQYSRLKSANITMNKERVVDAEDLFHKNELGLVAGIEYDVFIHKNYFMSFGIRGSVSSDPKRFPYFATSEAETYNFLIGINTSINYQIPKRKRKTQ